jgi:hypothetical protein
MDTSRRCPFNAASLFFRLITAGAYGQGWICDLGVTDEGIASLIVGPAVGRRFLIVRHHTPS